MHPRKDGCIIAPPHFNGNGPRNHFQVFTHKGIRPKIKRLKSPIPSICGNMQNDRHLYDFVLNHAIDDEHKLIYLIRISRVRLVNYNRQFFIDSLASKPPCANRAASFITHKLVLCDATIK